MTFYLRSGNTFRQTATIPSFEDRLPTGTYVLKRDDHGWFYEQIENFEMPKKVYGDHTRNRDRIISTFLSRSAATGVMLSGEKGSGKTLLGKALSLELQQGHEIPTIVVNTPWHGDAFNSLVQEMKQPCLWLFDEFEKVYDENQQEAILTLLDGVYPTKKLFVITTNDKWRIDKHMRNRPGRIFYLLDFKGLDGAFVREYAEDNLKDKSQVDSVCLVSILFSQFNFDMLKALVEEMNRYDETAQQAMQMLNAKPEFEGNREYDVRLWIDGGKRELTGALVGNRVWNGNPITGAVQIPYFSPDKNAPDYYEVEGMADALPETDGDEDYDTGVVSDPGEDADTDRAEAKKGKKGWTSDRVNKLYRSGKLIHTQALFTAADIKKVDGDGCFFYKNARGETMQLTRKFRPSVNYWDSLS